jgi:sortase (surface protein transpeptidase)
MIETIEQNLKKFIILWVIIFLGSVFILSRFNLVPETWDNSSKETSVEKARNTTDLDKKLSSIPASLPKRIIIPALGTDSPINNPESKNIDILDRSLQNGVVRYPSSGMLGQKTNMLLFGHSSYLPVVKNENYKALNGLDDLEEGDEILLFSASHKFIYKIKSVEKSNSQNALVVFESDRRELTISTCDSFGNLEDRFVAKAELSDVLEI